MVASHSTLKLSSTSSHTSGGSWTRVGTRSQDSHCPSLGLCFVWVLQNNLQWCLFQTSGDRPWFHCDSLVLFIVSICFLSSISFTQGSCFYSQYQSSLIFLFYIKSDEHMALTLTLFTTFVSPVKTELITWLCFKSIFFPARPLPLCGHWLFSPLANGSPILFYGFLMRVLPFLFFLFLPSFSSSLVLSSVWKLVSWSSVLHLWISWSRFYSIIRNTMWWMALRYQSTVPLKGQFMKKHVCRYV